MRFSEVDILGVLVSPVSVMMLAAWLIILPLRNLAGRAGLLHRVWHRALFVVSAYVVVLAGVVYLVRAA